MSLVSFSSEQLDSLFNADFSKSPYQRIVYVVMAEEVLKATEGYVSEFSLRDPKVEAQENQLKEVILPLENSGSDVIMLAARLPFNERVLRYLKKGVDTVNIDSEMSRIAGKVISNFGWDVSPELQDMVTIAVRNCYYSKNAERDTFPGTLNPGFCQFAAELNYQLIRNDRFDLIKIANDLQFFGRAA